MDDARGWYVYGVVREDALPAGVEAVAERGLAAVVREVPLSEYGEAALRENLEDIVWLEEVARRHETVLGALATTVIPLRLCTIYRSEAAVREMLATAHEELDEALERLDGRTEWGVKAFHAQTPEPAAESGGAYMRQRAREARARRERAEAVEEAFARLAALAEGAVANPLQRRELTGREDEMVLNGVFLVDDAAEEDFHAAVAELAAADPALSFELTGPWPPYNFVEQPLEAAR